MGDDSKMVDARQIAVPVAALILLGGGMWSVAKSYATITTQIDGLVDARHETGDVLEDIRNAVDRLEQTQSRILSTDAVPRAEWDRFVRELSLLNPELKLPQQ
jgi:hypothetical protein